MSKVKTEALGFSKQSPGRQEDEAMCCCVVERKLLLQKHHRRRQPTVGQLTSASLTLQWDVQEFSSDLLSE